MTYDFGIRQYTSRGKHLAEVLGPPGTPDIIVADVSPSQAAQVAQALRNAYQAGMVSGFSSGFQQTLDAVAGQEAEDKEIQLGMMTGAEIQGRLIAARLQDKHAEADVYEAELKARETAEYHRLHHLDGR